MAKLATISYAWAGHLKKEYRHVANKASQTPHVCLYDNNVCTRLHVVFYGMRL